MTTSPQLGILGCGVMAEAILSRLLAQGCYQPDQVMVTTLSGQRQAWLAQTYGVKIAQANRELLQAPTLLLSIKPQVFLELGQDLHPPIPSSGLLLSIVTGISLSTLEQVFPGRTVIRAVPNTPGRVGAGITAIAAPSSITPPELHQAETFFQVIGQVITVPEKLINSVTALAGSGPAFVALIVEALTDGGVLVGLPRPTAQKLVLATITGTIKLLEEQNLHPGQLKDQVTSPGGTTITGLSILEAGGVRGSLIKTIQVAQARAVELGQIAND
ncbi:pyrroline-5-carboxylate reductase [Synechococcus sp. PCC 6312]|uniref:pyrroline-5-carboxylate reductase n=1 Tax=Synechococcus sp. (strain ATCC 27167 / PCC 6312) TaxID=195253 RepID=UPI00029ECF29|nr:pyrroline-5-carboxylate reductase [Synechococcus sp. PCC 6312]AFY61590.1 pyrroline-5-carboxylate reductase [Synechococcus sp. PCC 6312]